METVRVDVSGQYERYESLLLQKDQLEKDGEKYYFEYIKLFGKENTENFTLTVECIALKKKIRLYARAKNRGEIPDAAAIDRKVEKEMTSYRVQLKSMIDLNKAANGGTPVSMYDSMKIKEIYRKLAKLLHPDISPLTNKYESFKKLFNEVIDAYKCNDLERLQELEVLVKAELEKYGIEGFDLNIPDVEKRIEKLEQEIYTIVNSTPYSYREVIDNDEAVKKKKEELAKKKAELTEYRDELQKKLAGLQEETNHV